MPLCTEREPLHWLNDDRFKVSEGLNAAVIVGNPDSLGIPSKHAQVAGAGWWERSK